MFASAVIGAAVIGSFGFAVEYFALDLLVSSGTVSSKLDLYGKLLLVYTVLLIPPFIAASPERAENAKILGKAAGLAILDIAKYISIGILIALGFNAFN